MPRVRNESLNGRYPSAGATFVVALFVALPVHAQTREVPVETPPSEPPPEAAPPQTAPVEVESSDTTASAAEASSGTGASGSEQTDDGTEVTIAGTRVTETPGSAYVINNKKLERTEYDDPLALLQTVPGVYVRTEDGVGLRPNIGLRGTNPNRSSKVALMEDGIPFAPAPYSAPAAYYFPLVTRMYQVRVLKGPATIVYGPQTVGGAIDLLTRPIPASPSGAVDMALGQYGYGKFHAWYGTSNESDGFLLEAVHLRNDGFKHLPDDSETGFYRNEWMVKASHAFDPSSSQKNELRLKATYSEEDSHETYMGLTDEDFRADPLQRYPTSKHDRMRWNRTAVVVTHELEPMRTMKITTNVYRNDFHRVWRRVKGLTGSGEGGIYDVLVNPDGTQLDRHLYDVLSGAGDSDDTAGDEILYGPNDREFVSEGIQSVVSFRPKTGPFSHRIEYGLRLHYDRVERRQSEDTYLGIGGELVPAGLPTKVTEYNEASTESAALYAIDSVTWKTLTVTPGVRIEFWRAKGINKITQEEDGGLSQVVLPGAGAHWAILPELGVFVGAYRGFSPPPPEIPRTNPDPTLEEAPKGPELSVNYEAGVRYGDAPAHVELVGYYNDYSNLTDICQAASGCFDQNLDEQFSAGRARVYGLEALAEHEPGFGKVTFPLSVSYTLTYAEFLERFDSADPMWGNVLPGDELPYVPRHQLNAQAGVETGQVGGYAAVNYVAMMREEAGAEPMDEALVTDEQVVVDVGAHYRVLEPLDLYLNVRNLFDSAAIVARRPFGARPNAPRWVQLGAKVKF
jgi:Fe(3+) dicitrate transport protein